VVTDGQNGTKSFSLKFARDRDEFARDYAAALKEAIDRGGLRCEPHDGAWTVREPDAPYGQPPGRIDPTPS